MQKKNNKGVIALIIVFVLAAAALVICQIRSRAVRRSPSTSTT